MSQADDAAAINAEYWRDFGRAPDENELKTDLDAAARYGLRNQNGPTGGVLGQISARSNNAPGSGQLGTPVYANSTGRVAPVPTPAQNGLAVRSMPMRVSSLPPGVPSGSVPINGGINPNAWAYQTPDGRIVRGVNNPMTIEPASNTGTLMDLVPMAALGSLYGPGGY